MQQWLPLLLPLLIGTFLRYGGLGEQALFLDEAFSADLVLRSWQEMLSVAMSDVHPPLFYVLLKPIVEYFPLSEWTLRLLSAFSSVLAMALAMGTARRLFGREAAAMTGWLLSWSALHLYYAQEARMYALLDVAWILAALALLNALRRASWSAWLIWSLVTATGVYVHFYGLVAWGVGALGGFVLLISHRQWRALRQWTLAQVIVLVAVLPLVNLFLRTSRGGVGGTWIPSWREPFDLLSLMLVGFHSVRSHFLNGHLLTVPPWNLLSRGAGEILVFFLTTFSLLGWRRAIGEKGKWLGWIVGIYALLPLSLVTLLLHITGERFWAYRPFIGTATLLLVGLAAGWSSLCSRSLRIALVGILLLLNVGSLWAYEFQWIKDYSQTAFEDRGEFISSVPAVVLDRYYGVYVFNFYKPDQGPPVFGLAPRAEGSFEIARILEDGTLRGQVELNGCEELPDKVALYDPAGRRFNEGDRWPACLRERSGWVFNPEVGQWEEVSQLIP